MALAAVVNYAITIFKIKIPGRAVEALHEVIQAMGVLEGIDWIQAVYPEALDP
jgi:hypothetical protein